MKLKYCLPAIVLLLLQGRLQSQTTLTGHITEANTETPVANVTVTSRATHSGTASDLNGNFAIDTRYPDTLVFSHINYIRQKIAIAPGSRLLNLSLSPRMANGDEVIVIGYGTTTKKYNTGSVSKISSAVIAQQPVANPLAALQGRAPGVFVSTSNGLPGGNINVQVRGKNSLDAGNNPLYIIDGVPFISAPLNTGKADLLFANDVISPLNSINPADIESIDILKDADATAIYGSRGANGIVLITTRKGSNTNTKFSINYYQGISNVAHYRQFLSLQQYLEIRNEAFRNDSTLPDQYSAPDLVSWDTTKSTDWQKYILGGTAHVSDVQASFSGGNASTNFLFSGNFRHETTVLPGNQFYNRGGVHFNLNNSSLNNRLNLSLTASFTSDRNVLPPPMDAYATLPPDFPLYDSTGNLDWSLYSLNPAATLMQKTESKTTTLIANLSISYRIVNNLTFKTSAGYTKTDLNQFIQKPLSSLNPLFGEPNGAVFGDNNYTSVIIEPQLNYDMKLGPGKMSAIAGSSWQNSNTAGSIINAINYSNEALFKSLSAAGNIQSISNDYINYKYLSFFGRINYNLLQNYIVNINFRRDGSSRFGPGKQYGNFGALGGAWLFTQEKFLQQLLSFLNFGKLRMSYGIVGNDAIQDYQYQSAYQPGISYGGTVTLSPERIANPDYEWETTKKTEAALELGFLKDRIQFNADWYRNTSSNQLVQYPLASQTGFTGYEFNLPALVKNTGWEFELHTLNIKATAFTWKTDFNITLPHNKLVSFPNIENTSYASRYTVGQSLDVFKGFKFLGVDPATGIAKYEDVNKDGQITQPEDFIAIGNQTPSFYGGFNNTFACKNFELSVFLQFVRQDGVMPSFAPGFDYFTNESSSVLKRWQRSGDKTNVPRAATVYGTDAWYGNYYLSSSSLIFTDASYCRLKTVSLSYTIPESWLKRKGMSYLRLYLQGENLLLLSNSKRVDPELLTSNGGIPPPRTFTTGIQVTF